MAMYEVEIQEKELEKSLRQIAKRSYEGDRQKAVAAPAKRAIRLESKMDLERSERFISHPFVGRWKDREDMKDSVAWVNARRRKETEFRRKRYEAR